MLLNSRWHGELSGMKNAKCSLRYFRTDLVLPGLDWEPNRKTKRQRWRKVKRSAPGAPLKARPAGRRARRHRTLPGVAALTSAQRNRPQSKHAPRGCGRRVHGRVGQSSVGAPPNFTSTRSLLPHDVEAGRSGGARSRGVDHAPRCPRRPRYCSRAAPAPRASPGGGSRPREGGGRPSRGARALTRQCSQRRPGSP